MSTTAIIAIIDVVFVLLLLLGFWVGSARGVKRSALELGLTIVGVVIAGFITPPITNAVLGIQITMNGQTCALGDILYSSLASSGDFGGIIEASPTLSVFLQKLPSVLLCAVFFLVINLVMRLFVYIIYKIIAVCAFKTRKYEKQQGKKRNWWLGGIIGAVKAFVLVLVIFMPLTSLVKLADNILPEPTASAESASETKKDPLNDALQSLPPIAKEITSCINKSAFGVLNGAVGLDDYIFDNLSAFKVENGQKVEVRKEVSEYVALYKDFYGYCSGAEISDLDWNEVSSLYSRATRGGLFQNIILPTIGEVVTDKDALIQAFPQLDEYGEIIDSLKVTLDGQDVSKYFTDDLDNLFGAVKELGADGYLAEVVDSDTSVPEKITSLLFVHSNAFENAVGKVLSVKTLQSIFPSVADLVISKIDSDFLDNLNTSFEDWDKLKTDIVGEEDNPGILTYAKTINSLIEKNVVGKDENNANIPLKITDIASDFKKLLLVQNDVPKIFLNLGKLLDKVSGLEILNGANGNVLDSLLARFELENIKEVGTETKASYAELFEHLSQPADNLLSLDLYSSFAGDEIDAGGIIKKFGDRLVSDYKKNLVADPENPKPSQFLTNTLLPLYESTFVREKFFSMITGLTSETGIIDLSLLDVYEDRQPTQAEIESGVEGTISEYNYAKSYANWQEDMPLLTQILTDLHMHEMTAEPGQEKQTMLEYLLTAEEENTEEEDGNKESKIDLIIKELDDAEAKSLVSNIMKARCTEPLKQQLSDTVASNLNDLMNLTEEQDKVSVSFDRDKFTGEHPQTDEIANIFVDFIKIMQNGGFGGDIKDMDLTLVGKLLEDMKLNAYRVELNEDIIDDAQHTYQGIMRGVFDKFVDYIENNFNVNILSITNKTAIHEVNFTTIFELIKSVQEAAEVFEGLEDVVLNSGSQDVGETVQNVLDQLKEMPSETLEENKQKLENVLDYILDDENGLDIEVNLGGQTETVESTLDNLKNEGTISDELYGKLKDFLGLGGNA